MPCLLLTRTVLCDIEQIYYIAQIGLTLPIEQTAKIIARKRFILPNKPYIYYHLIFLSG